MNWTIQALGSNGSGQLGVGHQDDLSTPEDCLFEGQRPDAKPVKLSSGGNHTLILFADGSVYAAGDTINGCCGLIFEPPRRTLTRFTKVMIEDAKGTIESFQDIACTWDASVFVTSAGSMFTCGAGAWGELGQGEGIVAAKVSKRITAMPLPDTRITGLSSSMGHVVLTLSNGETWGWGNGRKGQLGEPKQVMWEPRRLAGLTFVAERVVCTKEATCLVGTDGCQILGSDKWSIQSGAPSQLPPWKDVSANWGTISVLSQKGKLLTWGRNDHSQKPPTDLPLVDAIASGSEHTVAKTGDGRILAWGWGEHGNCGQPLNARKDTENVNVISSHPSTAVLGAGCATSFILLSD